MRYIKTTLWRAETIHRQDLSLEIFKTLKIAQILWDSSCRMMPPARLATNSKAETGDGDLHRRRRIWSSWMKSKFRLVKGLAAQSGSQCASTIRIIMIILIIVSNLSTRVFGVQVVCWLAQTTAAIRFCLK